MDILGEAMIDYQTGHYTEDIMTYLSIHPQLEVVQDDLPLPYLFRPFNEMPKLEKKALKLCHGTVLDIGCGAGSHSLYLQKKGVSVTALDYSKGAIETCKTRGIVNCVRTDIMNFTGHRFDTLLLLMNGLGIAGTIEKLELLLHHLSSLLHPNAQILVDSSDIIYLFHSDEDGGHWIPAQEAYYGEVQFQMEYKGKQSTPFEWLYLDFNTLQTVANANNFSCELVSEGDHYDYLARITLK
ncbi:class I SAM-dependent methyltransferase [Maribacter sp. 2307UL18-2]|uniref:class I SAM-dependent methyltransferase n=1 Tax=Maribacter sp. 2307UL18-2 TaxID=3386274 RepID=UPI0039BD4072